MSGPPFKLDLVAEAAAALSRGGLLGGAVASTGALAGVLLLPLAVPLLIFGAGASTDASSGALLLEAAISLLLIAAAPFVTGTAIRAART